MTMCEYGNCHEEDKLPVLITTKDRAVNERKRFCSEYHAALWLLGYTARSGQDLNRKMSAMAMLDVAHKEPNPWMKNSD